MSAAALVAQLRHWQGTGAVWQLLAAFDYDREGFELALAWAVMLGWIVLDVDPVDDPEEDLVVITHRGLLEVPA